MRLTRAHHLFSRAIYIHILYTYTDAMRHKILYVVRRRRRRHVVLRTQKHISWSEFMIIIIFIF